MIDPEEIRAHAASWGTSDEQIRKDHLISHLLNALPAVEGFVFFGGTALNRTIVADGRLSEDIDLYLDPTSPAELVAITAALTSGTRSEFPDLRIVSQGGRGDVQTYAVTTEDLMVRLQVVGARQDLSRYETEIASVALRYSDLPASISMRVPVSDAFVAMKCVAFEDRRAPRDLHDLGSLVRLGLVRPSSIQTLVRFRGFGPVRTLYTPARSPSQESWALELAHQVADPGSAKETLALVRDALAQTADWE